MPPIQSVGNRAATTVISVGIGFNLAFSSDTKLGSTIVYLIFGHSVGGLTLSSSMVTSGYSQAGSDFTTNSGHDLLACWYKPNSAVIPAGTNQQGQILWTGSQAAWWGAMMLEYPNNIVGLTSPFDTASGGNTNATTGTPNAGAINPSTSGGTIISTTAFFSNSAIAAGAGYTLDQDINGGVLFTWSIADECQDNVPLGTQIPAWGTNNGVGWMSRAWAFKGISSAPNTTMVGRFAGFIV